MTKRQALIAIFIAFFAGVCCAATCNGQTQAMTDAKNAFEDALGDFQGACSGVIQQCDDDVLQFLSHSYEGDGSFNVDEYYYVAYGDNEFDTTEEDWKLTDAEGNSVDDNGRLVGGYKGGCIITRKNLKNALEQPDPSLPMSPDGIDRFAWMEYAYHLYRSGSSNDIDECIIAFNTMESFCESKTVIIETYGDAETLNADNELTAYIEWANSQGGGSGGGGT